MIGPLRTGPARLVLVLLALALSGGLAGCGAFGGGPAQKSLVADFERAVGLYVSSDVRVLGVRIGEVTAIEPQGDSVRVTMTYDAKYDVPADAQAVLVAPSIVSDRYVQLTPVFQGGDVLADGARLATDRTDVPVELDQIYSSLNELNLALGPKGANKDGALSDLIDVGADNLQGNGELLNSTLKDFATLVSTVSNQRDDLFGTVANLQDFTTTIAQSDRTVRTFNRDLAAVADQLAAEREDLARAVQQLAVALGEVSTFVRDNKEDLTANVTDLASVTSVLVKQRAALEEFLDVAPTALSNLQLAYNPDSGTLDTRDNSTAAAEGDPFGAVCTALVNAGEDPALCEQLTGALRSLPLPPPPGSGGGSAPPTAPQLPAGNDRTLGGILSGGAR